MPSDGHGTLPRHGGVRGFLRDGTFLGQHRPAPAVPKTMHNNLRLRLCRVHMMLTQRYGRPFPRKFSVEEAVAMQKKEGAGQQELQLFSAGAR